MAGYTKLFGSIISSTIWGAEDHVRLVWVTMLALADQYGRVEASIPGLAHHAHVSLENTRAALIVLAAPDADSRTPDNEGRRIEKMDGGWRLLNHRKYREKQDEEAQRERNAERQRRFRGKRNGERNAVSRNVTESNPIAEAEAVTVTSCLGLPLSGPGTTNSSPNLTLTAPEPSAANHRVARFTASEIESIYERYPRKVAKDDALRAIKKALENLDDDNPVNALRARVMEFAASPAGMKGQYVPYPASWFNAKHYLDDPKEWEK